jgi:methylglutaconyl-CoA hydratase
MENGYVKSSIENGIATVIFFHPQSNSLPGDILRALAVEITSDGEKAFCAGASFDELMAIKDIETGKHFFAGFAGVINAMRKAPKFVIARVQGKAVGGGVGLASAADYTLAHEGAAVKLSELAVGIGPFVVGPAVERKMGNAAFCQLTINAAEWHTAQFAKEKGLYAGVFKTTQELDAAVMAIAQKLAQSSPEAMKMLKTVMWEGTNHWDTSLLERAEMSGTLVLSDFTKNFIAGFKKK